MKKIVLAVAFALVFAPSAFAQQPSQNANQAATVKTCKNLKAQVGKRSFNAAFAPRTWAARAALRNCARKEAAARRTARVNAAHACLAWARGEDAEGFEEVFGEGTTFETRFTGPNARGKCVSAYARIQNQARREALVNGARACRPSRANPDYVIPALAGTAREGQTFSEAFGTARNRYGKCVSFLAKALRTQTATP